METEKRIIGRCPLCGGNVVKTCKTTLCSILQALTTATAFQNILHIYGYLPAR